MTPDAIIIQRPDIDFVTFLGIALKVLGRSPAAMADASAIQLTDASRFLSCLASMRNPKALIDLNERLLPHISYSVLLVADEPDTVDILECAAGMPFVVAETVMRGVLAVIITGTLAQWKAAVLAGSSPEIEPATRFTFNKLHGLFRNEGLNLWAHCRQRQASDQWTYLLEDKREH